MRENQSFGPLGLDDRVADKTAVLPPKSNGRFLHLAAVAKNTNGRKQIFVRAIKSLF